MKSLPTLVSLARSRDDIEAQARRIAPQVQEKVRDGFVVDVAACASEVGSGASPVETIASAGLAIRPREAKGQRALIALTNALRELWPVVGRISDGALVLDLRCLNDDGAFIANLAHLKMAKSAS